MMGKANKYRKLLMLTILFSVLLNGLSVYATSEHELNLEKKINQQNEDIIDALKNSDAPSTREDIERIMNYMSQSMNNKSGSTNLNKVKLNLLNGLFNLAITLRKYIIPFYMFIIVSNIILIAFLGSKSLQKRKAYIVGSISLSILFVILMNIPIFMIYFQSNSVADTITLDSTNNNIYKLIYFLRDNSLPLCIILFIYGVLNSQLGKNDVPRRITGKYFKNTACAIFLVLQMLPIVINFII